jgi:hypothetical protein
MVRNLLNPDAPHHRLHRPFPEKDFQRDLDETTECQRVRTGEFQNRTNGCQAHCARTSDFFGRGYFAICASFWFDAEGFKANIAELRRNYPDVHLRTLEEWFAG